MEASTATAAAAALVGSKRPLVLDVPDDDAEFFDGVEYEPTFVAGADGAYSIADMPKRIHCGHEVGERCPRMRAVDADDERSTAMLVRVKSAVAAAIRDMKAAAADAAAAAAAPPGRVVG